MSEADCTKCLIRDDQIIKADDLYSMIRYIPNRIVRAIGESPCCLFERKVEHLEGVIAYFDIVGFTPIVAEFMKDGGDVASMSNSLCDYYSIVIEIIREFGGSVFQFAGDSILICFDKLNDEPVEETWARGFAAMVKIREIIASYNAVSAESNGFSLIPKIGMSFGGFYQIFLGSKERYITPVLSGPAITDAVRCEKMAQGNEIIVNSDFYAIACLNNLTSFFEQKEDCYLLKEDPEDFVGSVVRPEFCSEETLIENPRYYNRLHVFINPLIQHQIKNNFQGFNGEYREMTCVMIHFDGKFTQISGEFTLFEDYRNLNNIYELIQDKAAKYGGYCTTPDMSDKGIVFPVLFGVPVALESKERNALLFSVELLNIVKPFPFVKTQAAGIATGIVYSGEFGGNIRKDYTIVGSTINLAARLMMQHYDGTNVAVFTDEATQEKLAQFCLFTEVPEISLKGFDTYRKVFYYAGVKKSAGQHPLTNTGLIGRDYELKRLMDVYQESRRNGIAFLPVIGDAGMGKSFLAETFLANVAEKYPDTVIIYGNCYQYEEATLFFCWRNIVKKMCGILDSMNKEEVFSTVAKIFEKLFPDDSDWITFFLNVLGYDFAESEKLAEIDVSIKQRYFFSLVAKIIIDYSKAVPLLIVLEDIHWSDSVSLNMLEYLANKKTDAPIFVLPLSRESDLIKSFFASHEIPVLLLKQLDEESSRLLAKNLLNMDICEEDLVDKIVAISDGNPFFIDNIVRSLISSNVLIKSHTGKNILSKSVKNIDIPSSIQDIILAQLNALVFEEQVVCKTASVIGRSFFTDVLRMLIPEGITDSTFKKALEDFEAHNLIIPEEDRERMYSFKHITIRDVVYDTILKNTRKELNFMLLSYLVKWYADNIASVVERLAYHALESHSYNKVFDYSLMSARKAEKQYVSAESGEGSLA